MPSTPDKNPILDALVMLQEQGFKKSARHWWRPNGETTFIIDVPKSMYANSYTIQIGIWLNELGPLPSSPPREELCHVRESPAESAALVRALRPDERLENGWLHGDEDPYNWRVRVVRDFMYSDVLPIADRCGTVHRVRKALRHGELNGYGVSRAAHALIGRTVSIYSFVPVTRQELARFFADMGGRSIDDDVLVSVGFYTTGDFVNLRGAGAALNGDLKLPEGALAERLGTPVALALALEVSYEPAAAAHSLKLARAFAERWPAVAAGTADDVLTKAELLRILRGERWAPIRSPDLALLFLAPPDPAAAIRALGGTETDTTYPYEVSMAETHVRALKEVAYSAERERIVGFIPAGGAGVWVLEDMPTPATPLAVDAWSIPLVTHHLGAVPTSRVRLAIGLDASPETQRMAFVAAGRMLGSQLGVVSGTFDFLLDAAGIGEMLESGRGGLIA